MGVTPEQYEVLLKPLAASRVAARKQAGITLNYLEAWDVKAHLIRIFGFGGWDWNVLSATVAFEEKNEKGQWSVGYAVLGQLRIPQLDCTYSEAAVGSATLPQRGEAHDMAVKTAESDALKRAAINLGTQFGLSLYDSGNRNDVVRHTLCPPDNYVAAESEPVTALSDAEVSEFIAAIAAAQTRDQLREHWDTALQQGILDEHDIRQHIVDRLAEVDA